MAETFEQIALGKIPVTGKDFDVFTTDNSKDYVVTDMKVSVDNLSTEVSVLKGEVEVFKSKVKEGGALLMEGKAFISKDTPLKLKASPILSEETEVKYDTGHVLGFSYNEKDGLLYSVRLDESSNYYYVEKHSTNGQVISSNRLQGSNGNLTPYNENNGNSCNITNEYNGVVVQDDFLLFWGYMRTNSNSNYYYYSFVATTSGKVLQVLSSNSYNFNGLPIRDKNGVPGFIAKFSNSFYYVFPSKNYINSISLSSNPQSNVNAYYLSEDGSQAYLAYKRNGYNYFLVTVRLDLSEIDVENTSTFSNTVARQVVHNVGTFYYMSNSAAVTSDEVLAVTLERSSSISLYTFYNDLSSKRETQVDNSSDPGYKYVQLAPDKKAVYLLKEYSSDKIKYNIAANGITTEAGSFSAGFTQKASFRNIKYHTPLFYNSTNNYPVYFVKSLYTEVVNLTLDISGINVG